MIRQVPLGDYMFITAEKKKQTSSGLILISQEDQLLSEQTVLKVGEFVKNVSPGDKVVINLEKFKKYRDAFKKTTVDPSIPDGQQELRGKEAYYEVPVYNIDGEEVICLSQYEIMPWKLSKEYIEEIDRTSIVNPNKLN